MNIRKFDSSVFYWFLGAALVAAIMIGVLAYHRTQSPTWPPRMINLAIKQVKRTAYDPYSLVLQDFTAQYHPVKKQYVVCGNINGKNLMGAYTGMKPVGIPFDKAGYPEKVVTDVDELYAYCVGGDLVQ